MIVLATLNARYAHASLGLRSLYANLGELQPAARIQEFVIGAKTEVIAEKLLASGPRIVGLGVYIWNVDETARLVALLKTISPQTVIVLGGPEVSHETDEQEICRRADYVITGWGDVTFARLCRDILAGKRILTKVHVGEQPPLAELAMPYRHYDDEDIRHRVLYVEASRGCPFKCEFCLSALDKTAWAFPLDAFLDEIASLYARGARQFKFVDRTFNLNVKNSLRILSFFLEKLAQAPQDPVFVHFEVVPDHLPDALKAAIAKFPPATLQFEIGLQTLNPQIQEHISRRTDLALAEANIRWLKQHSQAHLHVDLIAGLPGETLESFGEGFDRLLGWQPDEIQLGVLKRLRGTPIIRHTEAFGMRYNPAPPYNVLATAAVDFSSMQRLSRFSRYWDLLANAGRFRHTLPLVLGAAPFHNFMALSDWLYATTGVTHRLELERLFRLLHAWLTAPSTQARPDMAADEARILDCLHSDYQASGARGRLHFVTEKSQITSVQEPIRRTPNPVRQLRHAYR